MNTTVTMDKAGRVVLPKAVRDELNLAAGDSLELRSDGQGLTLQPVRASGQLVRKGGFWVFRGGDPVTVEDVNDWIRADREARDRKNLGLND